MPIGLRIAGGISRIHLLGCVLTSKIAQGTMHAHNVLRD